jgi:hypothetical protein
VSSKFLKEDILKFVEQEIQLGIIYQIDILPVEGKRYNKVFIHFSKWTNLEIRDVISLGKYWDIQTNNPRFFWRLLLKK